MSPPVCLAVWRPFLLTVLITELAGVDHEVDCVVHACSPAKAAMLLQTAGSTSRTTLRQTSAVAPEAASEAGSAEFNLKEEYLQLLTMALTGSLSDEAGACVPSSPGGCSQVVEFNSEQRERGLDWPPYGQTMVGHMRLRNVRMAIEETVKNNVPGDFAELGTWRGGTTIFAKAVLKLEGQKSRNVHLFDAFDSIPSYGNMTSFLTTSQESVEHNFKKYSLLDDSVKFHKGLFNDTLPAFAAANPGQQLSVLRIDANFYDSYQDALYYLYPMVPVGGIVIFDDVYINGGKEPVMQCWLDFKADNKLPEELTKIDDVSAWFRKTTDVSVDRKHMRAVQDGNLR